MPELEQFIPVQLKTEETGRGFSFCKVFKHLLLIVTICNEKHKALLEKHLKALHGPILLAQIAGNLRNFRRMQEHGVSSWPNTGSFEMQRAHFWLFYRGINDRMNSRRSKAICMHRVAAE